jgi:hypothetical protein
MLRPKTHYREIPLEAVMKIVERQRDRFQISQRKRLKAKKTEGRFTLAQWKEAN